MTRALNMLFRGVEILMAAFLAVMVLLVFLNVILRYFFASGLVWSEEVARLCFIYLVYFGAIGAFRDNRHLGVNTILERVPAAAQKVLYVLVQAVIIWVMVLLAHGSWELAAQIGEDRWVATQFPRALVYGIGIITGAAIALVSLGNIFRLLILKTSVEELLSIPQEDDDLLPQAAK